MTAIAITIKFSVIRIPRTMPTPIKNSIKPVSFPTPVCSFPVFYYSICMKSKWNTTLLSRLYPQHCLHLACSLIMLLTYDSGIQDTGCGLQRVYCGIDSQFYDRTGQNRGGIQMCECGRRCRVCQVIRRHIDCLYGSMDPFLVDVIRSCSAPISVARVGW